VLKVTELTNYHSPRLREHRKRGPWRPSCGGITVIGKVESKFQAFGGNSEPCKPSYLPNSHTGRLYGLRLYQTGRLSRHLAAGLKCNQPGSRYKIHNMEGMLTNNDTTSGGNHARKPSRPGHGFWRLQIPFQSTNNGEAVANSAV